MSSKARAGASPVAGSGVTPSHGSVAAPGFAGPVPGTNELRSIAT